MIVYKSNGKKFSPRTKEIAKEIDAIRGLEILVEKAKEEETIIIEGPSAGTFCKGIQKKAKDICEVLDKNTVILHRTEIKQNYDFTIQTVIPYLKNGYASQRA